MGNENENKQPEYVVPNAALSEWSHKDWEQHFEHFFVGAMHSLPSRGQIRYGRWSVGMCQQPGEVLMTCTGTDTDWTLISPVIRLHTAERKISVPMQASRAEIYRDVLYALEHIPQWNEAVSVPDPTPSTAPVDERIVGLLGRANTILRQHGEQKLAQFKEEQFQQETLRRDYSYLFAIGMVSTALEQESMRPALGDVVRVAELIWRMESEGK